MKSRILPIIALSSLLGFLSDDPFTVRLRRQKQRNATTVLSRTQVQPAINQSPVFNFAEDYLTIRRKMIHKKMVHQECILIVRQKIAALRNTLKGLTESAANETKSTAGDKHETALAMLQIEQENTSRQLNILVQQLSFIETIDPSKTHLVVSNGSLVKTNKGFFYIAVGLGKIVVAHQAIFVVSKQSPVGNKLVGLSKGAAAIFNNTSYLIEAVS